MAGNHISAWPRQRQCRLPLQDRLRQKPRTWLFFAIWEGMAHHAGPRLWVASDTRNPRSCPKFQPLLGDLADTISCISEASIGTEPADAVGIERRWNNDIRPAAKSGLGRVAYKSWRVVRCCDYRI